MANHQNNQISPLVNSNAYDPNNLSIFPDLLEQINPHMAIHQEVQAPAVLPEHIAVLPEHFAGEIVVGPTTRIVTIVVQGFQYNEENNELLVVQQGAGSTSSPSPTLNINPEGSGVFPTIRRSAAISGAQIQDSDKPTLPAHDESPLPDHNLHCPICMDQISEPTATKCGHLFCWSCIYSAYEAQRCCPICRERIDTRRHLRRIYLS